MTSHQVQALIRRYFLYSTSSGSIRQKRLEKKYLGETLKPIPFRIDNIKIDRSLDLFKRFVKELCNQLHIIPSHVIRMDSEGKTRKHSVQCEFASESSCTCWCNYEYHGFQRVFLA